MKKLILILLALCPIALFAQNKEKVDLNNLPNVGGKEAVFIVDGKKAGKSAAQAVVNGDDVADITILNAEQGKTKYGADGTNGVIVITTQKHAIAAYQEKFSDFSADYESYLTSHGTDDKQFVYLVDNVALPKDKKEAGTLMNIPKDKIKNVVFIQDQPEGSKILAKVAITTKK